METKATPEPTMKSQLPPDAPDLISFTDMEKLEVENIQLKVTIAQHELQRLMAAQAEWFKKVSDRVGVPEFNKHYAINLVEGTARKIQQAG